VKAKKELIRIVKSPSGIINVDLNGKGKGRGAYVCFNTRCINKAINPEYLNRAFKIAPGCSERINPEITENLRRNLLELMKSQCY
jgi:hypothetical protein